MIGSNRQTFKLKGIISCLFTLNDTQYARMRFLLNNYAIVFWVLFICPGICTAQEPKLVFKKISTDQGLSNSTIETIFQDSRGFMWFGTRDGLNRYDGYQVTIYRYDSKDTNSISDNYISCIYEDNNHLLCVGTNNGLNVFDAVKNRFTRFKHLPANTSTITHNKITSVCLRE